MNSRRTPPPIRHRLAGFGGAFFARLSQYDHDRSNLLVNQQRLPLKKKFRDR